MSLQPSAATVEPLEEAEALDGRQRVRLPRKFWVGAAIVALYALLALLAPWVAPHDPDAQDVANRLADPSWKHPVGTDELAATCCRGSSSPLGST